MVLGLYTPVCLKTASKAASDPAKAPVWDFAALAPRSDLPALSITMGFFLEALSSALNSCGPFLVASMYAAMHFVFGSFEKYVTKSASSVSALFPELTNPEHPSISETEYSIAALQNAPLWEKKAICPDRGD